MTDFPDTSDTAGVIPVHTGARRAHSSGYRLEETYWGYRIVPIDGPQVRLIVQQAAAMIAGASSLAAAVTLAATAGPGELAMRLPVVFVALCIGIILMWYASRGTQVQIEIDTLQAEVRAVVSNRTGATTIMARYGFDSIGNVFIVRPADGLPTLTLRYRDTVRQLRIATGAEADLIRLRDRLGRDLILNRDAA